MPDTETRFERETFLLSEWIEKNVEKITINCMTREVLTWGTQAIASFAYC